MIRPNYRDFRRSAFIVVTGQILEHSAKGSSWKQHKYIKRVNGTYYYPDSYVGGRHLPDGEKGSSSSDDQKSKSKKLEDWEKTMYDDIEATLKRNPNLFDPKDLTNDDFQDFRITLSEFAGIDADELTDEEVERMRKKVQEHFSEANKSDSGRNEKLEDWEETMYEDIEATLKKNPNLFDPKDLTNDDFQDFRITLSEFAGVDADELSDEEVERMRKKVQEHFGESSDSDVEEALEDWEETLYDDVEETLKRNPGLFNPKDLTNDNFQDFEVTLAEFAGVDPDELSKEEIERMRKKVADHYEDMEAARRLDENDIEKLANEVIRGNFGNGQVRKDLLGENYAEVQQRVNEILLGSAGSKKVSEASKESVKKVEEVAKGVADVKVEEVAKSGSEKKTHSGVNMDEVMSVYKKKK